MTIKKSIEQLENIINFKYYGDTPDTINAIKDICEEIKDLLKQYEWHLYPQEKPSHSCICAVILNKSYDVTIDTYLYKEYLPELNSICTGFNLYGAYEKNIVAWMEIPKYKSGVKK